MKRKFAAVIAVLMSILALAALVACGEPDLPAAEREGPEMGEYYCDAGEKEYTLTLSKGDRYLLVLGGEEYSGGYTLNGQSAVLSLPDGGQASATIYENYLTLLFGGDTYKFYRKLDYTVSYSTYGGTAIPSAQVRNGRTAARPDDPQKSGLVFVGWYTDPEFSEIYRFDLPVTKDITLHARYTEPLDPEFTVKFSAGAESFPEVKTRGGMVFDLPVPAGEGEFAGWWLSHENRADRLTCQYTGQILRENTTLFAVWKSDAPTLSVEEKQIVWSSEGYGNFYDLVIRRDGNVVHSESLTASSCRYDFAAQPMGEYEIELTLNGKETVRAYYRNRALARVSSYRVEGNVFLFGGVENASEYEISVLCGTPEHTHTSVPLGSETRFDFGECDMREGGIVFVVTARAEDHLPSVSEEFRFERTLEKAVLTLSPDEETVRWEGVENAASYDVRITLGGTEVASFQTAATQISLKEYDAGELTVSVTPKAFGWNSPAAAQESYTKMRLAVPQNVRIEGSAVVWESVRGALGYEVKLGGQTLRSEETRLVIDNGWFEAGKSEYPVSVRALKGNEREHSLWSDEIILRYGTFGGQLRYADGQVAWDAVIGARVFLVDVDGEEETFEDVTVAPVVFRHAGENVIRVRAKFADGTLSEPLLLRVTVYELSFEDPFTGRETDSLFLAAGDRISALPSPVRPGYTFAGWYTAAEGGRKYEDSVYTEGRDRTLFALWEAETYHVSFSAGVFGVTTPELQEGKDVLFGEKFTFPVPASTDARRAFLGWYTEEENGIAYTRYNGESVGTYNQTRDLTLYARFEIVFSFTQQRDNHGQVISYQISKDPRLITCGLPEITIPASYEGRPVRSVYDFTDCTGLEVVNIPDSVSDIMVAVRESAFTGCVSLREINILPGEGGGKYSSDDGVLFYRNSATGRLELKYYPMGRTETVYRIPDGVQVLPASVFYNVRVLEEIVVPASVVTVEIGAFSFPENSRGNALKKVTFLPGEGPALDLREGAFDTCQRLAEVQLPSRVKEMELGKVFVNCSGLKNITVAGTGGVYSSEDGLLCKNIPEGKELVYWPAGRSETFTLPVGIVAIGEGALMGRWDITEIIIPGSVSVIGANAFRDCINVRSITFTGTVWNAPLTIGEGAFAGCSNEAITEISLPENLVTLRKNAFDGVKATTVTVNSALTLPLDFSDGAFGASSSVNTLHIGKSVSNISFVGVFGSKIKNIVVDPENDNYSSVEGDNVIYNKEMTVIAFFPDDRTGPYTLPVTVTELPANVFKGKKNLTEITLHGALKVIGDNAFEKSGLAQISVPGSVTLVGASAFANCTSLTSAVFERSDGELTVGEKAFDSCRGLLSVTFGEGLSVLGKSAFISCNAIQSVSLPASLKEIVSAGRDSVTGDPNLGLFGEECLKLSSLTVAEENTCYGVKDGSLYLKAYDETDGRYYFSELMYHIPGAGGEVVLENTVERIWQNAFSYSGTPAQKITKVSVEGDALAQKGDGTPRSLRIGSNAFKSCAASTIRLPAGTGVIAEKAFYNCKSLTTVNIPNTVSSISGGAFEGCSRLTTVTFDEGNDDLPLRFESKSFTFNGGTGIFGSGLTSLELPERTSYIGAFTFPNLTKVKTLVIPRNVTVIDDYAFYNCRITSLTLPEDGALEGIGASAFYQASITSLNIPASVARIGASAFENATKLGSVTFADGSRLTELGVKALSGGTYADAKKVGSVFKGCRNLTEVDFGEGSSLRVIHESSFAGCSLLSNIVLPASVETVGQSAFEKCSALSSLTFAVGEEGEGDLSEVYPAFAGTAITRLELPASAKDIVLHERLLDGSSVEELYLSAAVSSIGDLLGNCKTLKTVTVAQDNPHFRADPEQPVLYNRADNSVLCIYGLITDEFRIDENATEIGTGAFRNQTQLTKLVIPRGVEVIGPYAFSGCTGLVTVEFAENCALREIGKDAFENCTSLSSLDLSETAMTELGVIFTGCDALEWVKLSPFINSIDVEYVKEADYRTPFRGLKGLRQVDMGMTTVTSIPNYLFMDAAALESVTLPATVTSIAKGAFKNCGLLSSVNLAFVSTVSDEAFRYCTSLKELDLRRAEFIGKWAFQGCEELLSVNFGGSDPNRSITLDNQSFQDCTLLSNVSLANVTSVGVSAFENCALAEADLSRTKTVGSSAFKNCAFTFVKVPQNVSLWSGTSATTGAFSSNNKLTEVVFSSGISSAVELRYLFGNCVNLQKATFESNVEISMGSKGLFEGCRALSDVRIADDGAFKTISEGMFKGCTSLATVRIPNSVTAVGAEAFNGCSSLGSIALASSEFGSGVFNGCSSLASVDLSASAAEELPKELFKECTALTSVRLPAAIVSLGASVFEGCRRLSEVVGIGNVERFGNNCFLQTGILSVSLSAGKTYGTGVFMNCKDLKEIDFGDMTSLPEGMFMGCTSIEELELPASLSSIGKETFKSCTHLGSVAFPAGLSFIGEEAFANCSSLPRADLKAVALRTLPAGLFSGCSSLQTVSLPAGLTHIGARAFEESGLTEIDLSGTSLTQLAPTSATVDRNSADSGIFSGCDELVKVVLPAGLTRIGGRAFENCVRLDQIELGNVTFIGARAFFGCNALTQLDTHSVTEVCEAAFQSCLLLKELNMPKLEVIGKNAFYNSGLEGFTLHSSVISVGDSAFAFSKVQSVVFLCGDFFATPTSNQKPSGLFSSCESLAEVSLPTGLTGIGASWFANCGALSRIVIPETVTSLDGTAFTGWSSSQTVCFTGTREEVEGRLGTAWEQGLTASVTFGN